MHAVHKPPLHDKCSKIYQKMRLSIIHNCHLFYSLHNNHFEDPCETYNRQNEGYKS